MQHHHPLQLGPVTMATLNLHFATNVKATLHSVSIIYCTLFFHYIILKLTNSMFPFIQNINYGGGGHYKSNSNPSCAVVRTVVSLVSNLAFQKFHVKDHNHFISEKKSPDRSTEATRLTRHRRAELAEL